MKHPPAHEPVRNVTVRFPEEVLVALRGAAADHRRSLNSEILWAVQMYLSQQQERQEKRRTGRHGGNLAAHQFPSEAPTMGGGQDR